MKHFTYLFIIILLFPGMRISAQGMIVSPGISIKVEVGTTLDLTGGDLTLESDDTGDASLIDLGGVTYSGGGEANVERYLTQGVWHLISSPVIAATAGMFENDYLQYFTVSTGAYTDIPTSGYQLEVMHGYSLWSVDDEPSTEIFSGSTNSGSTQFIISSAGARYNLIGNPYPSAIDWDEVSITSNLDAYFYVWNPEKNATGDWEYYITGGGGANTTSQYIASGQAFFVRTPNSAASGNFTLDNSVRTHSTQTFYKNKEAQQMLLLKISGNGMESQTAIRFLEEATAHIDRLYDVEKMFSGNTDIPSLYSFADDEKMALNSLPSIDAHQTIPVAFTAGKDGTYTIGASQLESIPDIYPVFLEDVERNLIHDLRANPEYAFDCVADSEKQFKVHFKDVTGVEEPANAQTVNISCKLINGSLQINTNLAHEGFGNLAISLYTISGQRVLYTKTTQPSIDIAFSGPAAMYIVSLQSETLNYSTKVINH